jgi:hypothetical protein
MAIFDQLLTCGLSDMNRAIKIIKAGAVLKTAP